MSGSVVATAIEAACALAILGFAGRTRANPGAAPPQPAATNRHPARTSRAKVIAGCGLLAFALNALMSLLNPPLPAIHDEFSYLLAADTFAHGRCANPPHPMAVHFETFHVIQWPTYASKYPPAQGLALAAGVLLAGRPIVGVWLGTALAAAAVAWMLCGWLPRRWAAFGGLLFVVQGILQLSWGQGYWGGAIATLGGALLFGGWVRLMRAPRALASVLLALGAAVLAASRPFEGFVACVPVAVTLAGRFLGGNRPAWRETLVQFLLPAGAVGAAAAGGMLSYNACVTGSPWKLPYQVHEAAYGAAPVFVFQSKPPVPAYRHAVLRDFHTGWALEAYERQQTLAGFMTEKAAAFLMLWWYFLRPTLTIPFCAALMRLGRRRPFRFAAGTLALTLAAASTVTWLKPHYVAPVYPLIWLLTIQGFRQLRAMPGRGERRGRGVVRGLVMLNIAVFVFEAALYVKTPQPEFARERASIAARLEQTAGRHLVIVQYSPEHNPHAEWVYNAADIDAAKVVWARAIDAQHDARLIDYFQERRVWVLNADLQPIALRESE